MSKIVHVTAIYQNTDAVFRRTSSDCYRVEYPVKYCSPILKEEGIEIEIKDICDNIREGDVVYGRGPNESAWNPPIIWASLLGKPIVWDSDDNYEALPERSVISKSIIDRDVLTHIINLQISQNVSFSTEKLMQAVCSKNNISNKAYCLPNLIDASLYREGRKDGPVRILWTGGASHHIDVELILDPLLKIKRKYGPLVEIFFYGFCPDKIRKNVWKPNEYADMDPTVIEWTTVDNYPRILTMINPDIGLAPLCGDEDFVLFNDGKSPIKWMEYSLSGAATIATNRGPYEIIEDEVTGFKAEDDEWYDKIDDLVDAILASPNRRWPQLDHTQHVIKRDHSWQHSKDVEKWLSFYRMISKLGS